MANLTFPSNPTNGQKVTVNDKVFVYNSTTSRWTATRLQVLGNLTDDFTIDAPTLGVSLSTVALDTVGANVYITYTVDQDVKATLTTSGLENTTATLHQTNNTIVVTAGSTEFSDGQINLVVTNGRTSDTETIDVSVVFPWFVNVNNLSGDGKSFNFSSQYSGTGKGVAFNDDGTRMFLVGGGSAQISQYTLSTPNDVSTASFDSSTTYTSGSAEMGFTPEDIRFNNNGTRLFTVDSNQDAVKQYSLSTPYDITSISYDGQYYVGSRESNPTGLAFSSDGMKLFIVGTSSDEVLEYDLYVAFDITETVVFERKIDGPSGPEFMTSIEFNNDGTQMFILGSTTDRLYQYSLSTPYSINTASLVDSERSPSLVDPAPAGFCFNNGATKFYVLGTTYSTIYQYSTGL